MMLVFCLFCFCLFVCLFCFVCLFVCLFCFVLFVCFCFVLFVLFCLFCLFVCFVCLFVLFCLFVYLFVCLFVFATETNLAPELQTSFTLVKDKEGKIFLQHPGALKLPYLGTLHLHEMLLDLSATCHYHWSGSPSSGLAC